MLVCKELLYESPVHSTHARMVDGKAVGKEVTQVRVLSREGSAGIKGHTAVVNEACTEEASEHWRGHCCG